MGKIVSYNEVKKSTNLIYLQKWIFCDGHYVIKYGMVGNTKNDLHNRIGQELGDGKLSKKELDFVNELLNCKSGGQIKKTLKNDGETLVSIVKVNPDFASGAEEYIKTMYVLKDLDNLRPYALETNQFEILLFKQDQRDEFENALQIINKAMSEMENNPRIKHFGPEYMEIAYEK